MLTHLEINKARDLVEKLQHLVEKESITLADQKKLINEIARTLQCQ